MASIDTNSDEVAKALHTLIANFTFNLPGLNKSFGEDAVDVVVEDIVDRTQPDPKDPDGSPWPDNKDDPPGKGYRSWKAKEFGAYQTGVLTGQMLSQESLRGKPVITKESIEMKYGTGSRPTRARYAPGADISGVDDLTDIEKAVIFSKINKIGTFYVLTKESAKKVYALAYAVLGKYLRKF